MTAIRKVLSLLLTLWLLAIGIASQAQADTLPTTQPQLVVLPNGVRLILKPEPQLDRTAVSLFVGVRPDASPNDAAVGEMVARTLFYGNATRTQNSIQALVGEVGGSLDVLRTRELVAINYVTVPAQLPEALHLVCDCLKYAAFAPESLHRALQTIHEERQTSHETAFGRGYTAVNELLGETEPGEDQLSRVTQAQARTYFLRQYVPAQTVISIAGRFDAVRVYGLLNAFLADYNRPTAFAPRVADTPLLPSRANGKPVPACCRRRGVCVCRHSRALRRQPGLSGLYRVTSDFGRRTRFSFVPAGAGNAGAWV